MAHWNSTYYWFRLGFDPERVSVSVPTLECLKPVVQCQQDSHQSNYLKTRIKSLSLVAKGGDMNIINDCKVSMFKHVEMIGISIYRTWVYYHVHQMHDLLGSMWWSSGWPQLLHFGRWTQLFSFQIPNLSRVVTSSLNKKAFNEMLMNYLGVNMVLEPAVWISF